MPPFRYWLMRTLRRHTPSWVFETMLDWGVLETGGETSASAEAVQEYADSAARHGLSLAGQRVCVVGSGGGLSIGIAFLEAGARAVVLQEPFAPPRSWRNRQIPAALAEKYLVMDGDAWRPRDERLMLVSTPLEQFAADQPGSIDFVVSHAVLQFVVDLDSLVAASARLMRPSGIGIHIVDLRDHYYRYPFEMLAYTQKTWDRWLKTKNGLNRLRRNDYERIFRRHYGDVRIETVMSLPDEFARAKPRIRPEFLSGDDASDAAGLVRIEARYPARPGPT